MRTKQNLFIKFKVDKEETKFTNPMKEDCDYFEKVYVVANDDDEFNIVKGIVERIHCRKKDIEYYRIEEVT
jgi:hypothetical protein